MAYRFVKITSFYRNFLDSFLENNQGIENKSYEEIYNKLMSEKYAWSDFFKLHLENIGNEAFEIVHNADFLQKAWSNEFLGEIKEDIVFQQIKYFKPDVIFIQDIKSFSDEYIKYLRKSFSFIKLITGHICAPLSKSELENTKSYDFIFTCLPTFAKQINSFGTKTYILHHAFEDSILENLLIDNNFDENNIIFIGSFVKSVDFHDERMKYIDAILKNNIDIKVFGNILLDNFFSITAKQSSYVISSLFEKIGLNLINRKINFLKKTSSLTEFPKRFKLSDNFKRKVINKTFYGLEMYKLLAKSKIGFNIHGGIAGKYAANIRLFETTGVGTLLLTDYKQNIKDFFEPDYEIVTYNSIDECIEKINWLEQNPQKVDEIRKAGQKRTLRNHTLKQRIEFVNEIITKHLK